MKLSETAEKMGREAFKSGKKCAPVLDKAVMDLAYANEVHFQMILKAWSYGWTEENIDAPIPGWTDEENQKIRDYRKDFNEGRIA